MTRSRKRSICLARNLFWVGTVVALGVATDVRSQDFSTGFELDRPGPLGFGALDIKEVFTLGDSPKSVTFSNARVAKKGQHFLLEDLPRKGEGAWIVGCQRIGVIVFKGWKPRPQVSPSTSGKLGLGIYPRRQYPK